MHACGWEKRITYNGIPFFAKCNDAATFCNNLGVRKAPFTAEILWKQILHKTKAAATVATIGKTMFLGRKRGWVYDDFTIGGTSFGGMMIDNHGWIKVEDVDSAFVG